jgi:hypothetical protein
LPFSIRARRVAQHSVRARRLIVRLRARRPDSGPRLARETPEGGRARGPASLPRRTLQRIRGAVPVRPRRRRARRTAHAHEGETDEREGGEYPEGKRPAGTSYEMHGAQKVLMRLRPCASVGGQGRILTTWRPLTGGSSGGTGC